MQVQVNTDSNIEGHEGLAAHVTSVVEGAVGRFEDKISRVQVHLTDENGPKSSKDEIRCVMEARIKGRAPTAVTHLASTVHQAVDGAADKLTRAVESTIEKIHDRH